MKFITPTLFIANLLATGYVWYTMNSRITPVEQLGKLHDTVLFQVVCTTRVTGIIDLEKCK
jgi:hypothetical protein